MLTAAAGRLSPVRTANALTSAAINGAAISAGARLRTAVETGTTLFDTADVYGSGRSETLIGKFLKETPAPIYVATKLGRRGDPQCALARRVFRRLS